MFSYDIPCSDGSDRHCARTLSISLPIDLDNYEFQELLNGHSVFVPLEDAEGLLLDMDAPEYNDDRSMVLISPADIGLESLVNVCGACGSDQTYDACGNNITAL